jgi:hypothetical protein
VSHPRRGGPSARVDPTAAVRCRGQVEHGTNQSPARLQRHRERAIISRSFPMRQISPTSSRSAVKRRLWQCVKCRRFFANRNQSHACGRYSLAGHFSGKPRVIRDLFDQVLAAIRSIGPVRVVPEKTRIAFQVRMSFAQVTPRHAWLDGHVVLARRLEHPRFRRVETFSARNHLHAFRIDRSSDIDAEFRAWLAEAYLVGQQQHLAPKTR